MPENKQRYFFSFFTEVANAGPTGAAEIYLDEFDKNNNRLGGQWLGGFYEGTFGLPGYLYQPSSQQVDQVMIDIYSLPGANITFFGSNFYFGVINNRKRLAPIINLLLGD